MNKSDFVAKVASESGLSQSKAADAVNAITSIITDELASGGKVQLIGFGTFETRTTSARTGRNPKTGESVDIPAKTVPKFSAGKAFKEAVK